MTNTQIHKRLNDDQVRLILTRYSNQELKAAEARGYLGLSKSRFYEVVRAFNTHSAPETFSIAYHRATPSRQIAPDIEQHILSELATEKEKSLTRAPYRPTATTTAILEI